MPLSRRVIRSTTTYIGGGASPPPPPPPPTPPAGFITKLFIVGDSIAAQPWRLVLADLMQARTGTRPTLYNHAYGGSRLGTAAQMAGVSMTGTVVGGQIPTSGAVEWRPSDPEFDLSEGGQSIPDMSLAGVTGVIRRTGFTRTGPLMFTRNVTGSAVPAGGTQPLIHLGAVARRSDSTLIVGFPHNNRLEALQQYPEKALGGPGNYITDKITEIFNYWLGPAFTYGGTSGPTVPERVGENPVGAFNTEYTDIFGTTGTGGETGEIITAVGAANWIDIRAGMISLSADPEVSAYAYNNLTPTAADISDAGAGKRYPGDALRKDELGHFHPTGQNWIAYQIYNKFIAAGLI